ncbi:lim-7, partial [Pristionchus pacificus]
PHSRSKSTAPLHSLLRFGPGDQRSKMAAVSAARSLYAPSSSSRPSSSSGEESESSSSSSSSLFWKERKEEEHLQLASTLINTPPSPNAEKRPTTAGGASSNCAGCGGDIVDQFIFHVHPDMQYHASCLKCAQCHVYLTESSTTFVRNGQPYCREDYERLFTAKCSRCARHLGTADLVMRAAHHVFHVDCFKCAACDRHLRTGDEYVVTGEAIFCRVGCNGLQDPSLTPSLYNEDDSWETSTLTSLDPPVSTSPNFSSPKSEALTPPSAFPSTVPLPPAHGMPQCLPPNGLSMNGGGVGKKSKKDKNNRQATRVRTVLNENQLLILKRCYTQNQRPDAIIKLVEATGLNARVIRVWFQNKRCKDKKRQIAIRDGEVNAARERVLTSVRMNGVGPFSVASPSSHVDPSLQGEVVHHYAQWAVEGCPIEPFPPGHHGPPGPQPPMGMSYTDLSGGPDPAMMHGFASMPHPPPPFGLHPPGFSPHIMSDLSSPSCSE